jgi:hypothetical protein
VTPKILLYIMKHSCSSNRYTSGSSSTERIKKEFRMGGGVLSSCCKAKRLSIKAKGNAEKQSLDAGSGGAQASRAEWRAVLLPV